LTVPITPVTPNVIEAETIPEGSVILPLTEKSSFETALMLPPTGVAKAVPEAEKSPVIQLPDAEVELL
jgi:hypothetical protein